MLLTARISITTSSPYLTEKFYLRQMRSGTTIIETTLLGKMDLQSLLKYYQDK